MRTTNSKLIVLDRTVMVNNSIVSSGSLHCHDHHDHHFSVYHSLGLCTVLTMAKGFHYSHHGHLRPCSYRHPSGAKIHPSSSSEPRGLSLASCGGQKACSIILYNWPMTSCLLSFHDRQLWPPIVIMSVYFSPATRHRVRLGG